MTRSTRVAFIPWLLKKFKEYERYRTGSDSDHVGWYTEFMEFIVWLSEREV
jgi:hypothetical protein